jgi:hypothetical protein
MLKDVDYKSAKFIHFTMEYTIRGAKNHEEVRLSMFMPFCKLGNLEYREEDFRGYVVVNPEYYAWHPTEREKRMTAKIIWEGAYFINIDKNLISAVDIYECWLDTFNEIANFISSNNLLPKPAIPPQSQFETQLDEFVHSIRRP